MQTSRRLFAAADWARLLRLEYQGDNLLAYFAASGLAAARHPGAFHAGWALVGALCLVVSQAALELLDGYHDHHQGAHGRKDGAPAWTGGSGVLAEGRVEPAHAHRAAWGLGALAFGTYVLLVACRTGAAGLVVGLIGCVVGAGWAMPPLKLSYRGLGEVLVAVVAGPLMAAQAWVVTSGRLDAEAFLVGVPFGCLQFAMAMAHGMIDRNDDARAGKRTLVVRVGRLLAARAHAAATVAALASALALVSAGVYPPAASSVLLAAPLAARSVRLVEEAAFSDSALSALARSYPPYRVLVAVGLFLSVPSLGEACLRNGPAGAFLAGLFVLLYAPVFTLLVRRWSLA